MANIRMRLFGDDSFTSPVSPDFGPKMWTEMEPDGVTSPFTLDSSDSGISLDSTTPQSGRRDGRFLAFDVKRSLFSGKRPAEHQDADETPSVAKRHRGNDAACFEVPTTASHIFRAVDLLSTEEDVVADGSRDSSLPTVAGKHRDLKSISPNTMADVITGCYDNEIQKVTVIDCRYPYEFKGGHIKGAVNLYTKDAIQQFLHDNMTSSKDHVLIFHCEFSSERGPKMYRFLRSLDRDLNKDHYPRLHFPEIYLLEGGYKAFFELHQELCDPVSYKPMLHKDHAVDLRHFRVKSKSWAAGEKQRKFQRRHSRQSLDF